jgi:hypothetical protein
MRSILAAKFHTVRRRAELFRDRSLGAVDKRMLMKFLQAVVETGSGGGDGASGSDSAEASIAPQSGRDALEGAGGVLEWPEEPFVHTLRRYKLSDAVQVPLSPAPQRCKWSCLTEAGGTPHGCTRLGVWTCHAHQPRHLPSRGGGGAGVEVCVSA